MCRMLQRLCEAKKYQVTIISHNLDPTLQHLKTSTDAAHINLCYMSHFDDTRVKI